MNFGLREGLNKSKVLLLVSLISVLGGATATLVGEVLLPVCASALAVVFLFDDGRYKPYFSVSCALLIGINVCVNFIFGAFLTAIAVEIIGAALIVALCYKFYTSKAFSAALLTVLLVLFVAIGLYLYGAAAVSDFAFDKVLHFYKLYIGEVKADFVNSFVSMTSGLSGVSELYGMDISAESLGVLFDSIINSIFSVILVLCFALSGFTFKLFTVFMKKLSNDVLGISGWRFRTSNVYAYFYIVITFLNVMTAQDNGVLGVAVYSATFLFMFVYAYLGAYVVVDLLSRRMRRGICWLIVIAAIFMLSTFALELLSYFGVFATIRYNRRRQGR